MPISKRNQAIFVEIEAVPGTAETLVGADAVQVMNLNPNPAEDLRLIEREIIRSSLNPEQAVYGGALFGFQFEVELKGSGTIDGQPRFGDLLRACGIDETITASTSVVYNPLSDLTQHETVTIGYQEGGNFRIVKGCRGTVSLNLTAGQYGKFTFNMKGRIHSETQTAAPTPSFETTVPRAFVGATFVIGGFAAPIEALTLDVGNTIAVGANPNNADGFSTLMTITARQTRGTVNPERELIGTKDYIGLFRAGTNQAIQTGVIGSVAGNRFALAIPNAYFRNVSPEDRDELLTYGIEFGARDTNGIDDFTLTMT
jgi:hypothetical protein